MLNKEIVAGLYKSLSETLTKFKETIEAHKDYEPSERELEIDKVIADLIALIEKED